MIALIRDIIIIVLALVIMIVILISVVESYKIKKRKAKEKAAKEAKIPIMPTRMLEWKYVNNNPHKQSTGDCLVRALCDVVGLGWNDVFEQLVEYSRKFKVLPNEDSVMYAFLDDIGWERVKAKKGMKIKELRVKVPALIENSSHAVYTDGSYYYDTYDSGDQLVNFYWIEKSDA